MTRKRVRERNVNVSISVTSQQKKFLETHPNFNLSKFVQLHLDDIINLTLDVERLDEEVNNEKTA